jgi:hypothetical protein
MAGRATCRAQRAPTAALAVLAVLAFWVPAAGADRAAAPESLDFGSQLVQSTGAPRTVTLSVTCSSQPTCLTDSLAPLVSVSGDFSQANDCPLLLTGLDAFGESCAIAVRFTPAASGVRTGTLSTSPLGPEVPLTGKGVGPVVLDTPHVAGACAKGKGSGKKGRRSAKKCKRKKPGKPKKPKKKGKRK